MEEEVAELLRAAGAHSGEAVEEAEEALALKVRHDGGKHGAHGEYCANGLGTS